MRSDCNFNYKELEYKSLIFNAGNMNDTISKYIMKKIVEIFYKNLDKDINFNEITYEREVISIPAADTINLIYGVSIK